MIQRLRDEIETAQQHLENKSVTCRQAASTFFGEATKDDNRLNLEPREAVSVSEFWLLIFLSLECTVPALCTLPGQCPFISADLGGEKSPMNPFKIRSLDHSPFHSPLFPVQSAHMAPASLCSNTGFHAQPPMWVVQLCLHDPCAQNMTDTQKVHKVRGMKEIC